MHENCDLLDFIAAPNVAAKWDAARRLMASKRLQISASDAQLQVAFAALGDDVRVGTPIDRLLAVDLLVRMPAVAKILYPKAATILKAALEKPLPQAFNVSDTATLPQGAKPAEVRENVALALAFATGDWVLGYLIDALAREDRSQRCRVELCRQLAARDRQLGNWLKLLVREKWFEILPETGPLDSRVTRLRDLASAVTDIVNENRTLLLLAHSDGATLDALARAVARVDVREAPSPRLATAATEVVRLLDAMIAAEFTLATEPETYEVLATIQSWWRPLPFPKELVSVLSHVERRLASAIALRARMGQRSDDLASRLSQALGPGRVRFNVVGGYKLTIRQPRESGPWRQ